MPMLNPTVIDQSDQFDLRQLDLDLDKMKSRIFLSTQAAFFGPLMCTLNFMWTTDPALDTAATDGVTFWWNVNDFIRCRDEGKGEGESTIMHELWHVARLHPLRRGDRCPDVWNIACDIMINRNLIRSKFFVGSDWIVRPGFDKIESEEDIYDLLKKPGGGGAAPSKHHCHNGQVSLSPAQGQSMVNATVKAVQSAKMANQAGSIPGNTEHMVNKFLAPKIPWETHLHRWMTDLLESRYSWKRPRRRMMMHAYLPTRHEDEGRLAHLVYFWDVSGSIGPKEELRFNSEVKFIWDRFKPKRLTVIQFDTRITKIDEWTEGMKFEEVKIVGKGGTCLSEPRQWIVDNKPTAAIIFSDLFCAPMAPGPTCPILWVAIGNTSARVPFGKLIHITA